MVGRRVPGPCHRQAQAEGRNPKRVRRRRHFGFAEGALSRWRTRSGCSTHAAAHRWITPRRHRPPNCTGPRAVPPVPARRCARARGGARGHRRGGEDVTRCRDRLPAAHSPGERVPPGARRSAVRVDQLGHRQAHRPGAGATGRDPGSQRLRVRRVRHGGRLQPPVEQDHGERTCREEPPRVVPLAGALRTSCCRVRSEGRRSPGRPCQRSSENACAGDPSQLCCDSLAPSAVEAPSTDRHFPLLRATKRYRPVVPADSAFHCWLAPPTYVHR